MSTARISPTAHITGFVWRKNGLSHPALKTTPGAALYPALAIADGVSAVLGGPTFEDSLLARHRLIDERLERAITGGTIRQVVEVAAGLSPRGLRLAHQHAGLGLTYVEGDLPDMVARKRALLARADVRLNNHSMIELDALAASGPRSLAGVCEDHLDPTRGTAIVVEGLYTYFDRDAVVAMWQRAAAALARFPRGLFLCDLYLESEWDSVLGVRGFFAVLGVFARGRVHFQFHTEPEAIAAARTAGFSTAALLCPDATHARRAGPVRILEATTS